MSEPEAGSSLHEFLYDPELFNAVARMLGDELTAYLRDSKEPAPVTKVPSAETLLQRARSFLDSAPRLDDLLSSAGARETVVARARELAREVLSSTANLQSPNYMGHQVNPPVPIAGLMQAMGGVLNPGLAIYEMSLFASAIERSLIGKLGSFIGWPEGKFDGVVTSGGTLSNLTALLSARNWRFPQAFAGGISGSDGSAPASAAGPSPLKPAILASADSHYSISRAAGILGLGTDQVLKIALDGKRRLDADALAPAFAAARAKGLDPFCIVAAAGSTPVGAFDPLRKIAAFAERHDLWLHVDGAHGGSLLLSEKHRHLLDGIDEADSITWDAHKMMFVPSLCTFLLYREARDSYRPFQQDAPYIFGDEPVQAIPDAGLRTFECTKPPIALPTWALWSLFSERVFAGLIERVIESTQVFYRLLHDSRDFAALHAPECNIICFRYLPDERDRAQLRDPAGRTRIDEKHRRLRDAVNRDGRFYITGTVIDGVYAFRLTVINPATGIGHFKALLDTIRSL